MKNQLNFIFSQYLSYYDWPSCFAYFYAKPLYAISKYVKQFSQRGYKVARFPYNPIDVPSITSLFFDKTGDPTIIYKTKYLNYDVVVGNYLTKPMLVFLSPEARKQFSNHEIDYDYVKIPGMLHLYSDVLGYGLFFSEGDAWKRKRRLLSKFFTFDFLQKLIPDISKICSRCFDQIEKESLIKDWNEGQQYEFLLFKLAVRVFSSVILSTFLGAESLQEKINGENACYFMINLALDNSIQINKPIAHVLGPKFLKLGLTEMDRKVKRNKAHFDKWVDAYVDKLILRAKSNKGEAKNLLQLLLFSNGEDKYSKKELIEQLKLFFFAGSETTSHLAEMMIYYTTLSPEISKKVKQDH